VFAAIFILYMNRIDGDFVLDPEQQ